MSSFIGANESLKLHDGVDNEHAGEILAHAQMGLRSYHDMVSPLIHDNSNQPMKVALAILRQLTSDISSAAQVDNCLFELHLTGNSLRTSEQNATTPYFGRLMTNKKWHAPVFAFYPKNERENWERFYRQLARKYEKEIQKSGSFDPYVLLFLPEDTQVASWVTSFGPLRIVSPKAKQLYEYGIGYHPHHEQEHAVHQINRPYFYFKILSSLTPYDEAFAILKSLQEFRGDYERFVSPYSQQVNTVQGGVPGMPTERDFQVGVSNSGVPIKILPMGNEVRRAHQIVGPAWGDIDELLPVSNMPVANSDGKLPNGNEHMYLSQLMHADIQDIRLKSFNELISPVFDSTKYPQFLCFALFLEEITAYLGWELNVFIDELKSEDDFRSLTQGDLIEKLVVTLLKLLQGKEPLGDYTNLASESYIFTLKEKVFNDLEKYCEIQEGVEHWDHFKKQELFWSFFLTHLIGRCTERLLSIQSIWKYEEDPTFFRDSVFMSQDERAGIEQTLLKLLQKSDLQLTTMIEQWWFEKGGELINERFKEIEVIHFIENPGE